ALSSTILRGANPAIKISHLSGKTTLAQSFIAATNFPDIDIEKNDKNHSQVSKGCEIKLTEPQSIGMTDRTPCSSRKNASSALPIKYQFFQLVQFKEINYRGVVKIAKKSDTAGPPENFALFDPTSEEYAAYGEVLLEKHKLLMNILGEDKILLEAMEGSDEASLFQKKVEAVEIIFEDVDESQRSNLEALEPPLSAYPGFKHYLSNNFLNSSSYSPLRSDLTTTRQHQVTGEDSERVLETILHTIQRVNPSLQFKVMDIDVFGRRPTHYALNNFPKLPLFYAILRGHAEVVEAIMQLFPNSINLTLTTSDQSIQSPLGLAASLGYPHLIQLLMRAGVNPFGTNESGETALHIAARNGFDDCVRELLLGAATEASLLANLKEYYAGYTALMLAATEGHANICDQLLAAGADPTIEDKWGWRALERDDGDVVHHPGSPKPPRKLVSLVDTSALPQPTDPVEFFAEADLFTELHNLKLVVSAAHLKEPLEFVDLPARGTQPIVIHTSPGAPVIVNFDIVSSIVFGGELLARGSWRVTARPTRARQCIALLRAPTMETVGHVNGSGFW
ncbi:Glycerophosphocholine phosphodiesterase, partial [Massospora cicadina]